MNAEPCPNCKGGWLCKPCQEESLRRQRNRSLADAGTASARRQREITRILIHFEMESDEFLLSPEENAVNENPHMNPKKKDWSVSDISNPIQLRSDANGIEFKDNKGEWHHFTIIATPERIVFGGCTNTGFLESGYIEREDGESIDETLQELFSDLECYYNDGPGHVSRIICNQRM